MRPRAARVDAHRAAVGAAVALGLLVAASAAGAQALAGTAGVGSRDRYRGMDAARPGAFGHVGVSMESAAGLYAGGLVRARLDDGRLARSQWLAGWSHPIDARWSWDAGIARTLDGEEPAYDETLWTVGATRGDAALRAWWSRHDAGLPTGALYLEAQGAHALGPRWRLLAHAGWQVVTGGAPARGATRTRLDALAGVAFSQGDWDLRATVDGIVAGRPPDWRPGAGGRAALVVDVTRAF